MSAGLRRLGRRHVVQCPAHLGELAGVGLLPTHQVDGPVLGGGHEPGARIVRDARLRPPLQGHHQRVLGQLFGDAHVPRRSGPPRPRSGGTRS